MQPHDLGRVVSVGGPAVSPDGRTVAVVVGRTDLAANRNPSAIWLVDAATGDATQLTPGDVADGSPTWSPDGTRLAFTRTDVADPPTTSVLVLAVDPPSAGATTTSAGDPAPAAGTTSAHGTTPAAGTTPVVVGTSPEAIADLDWSPDGRRLAWSTRVPEVAPGTKDRDRPPRRITTLRASLDDDGWTVDRRRQCFVAPADGSGPVRAVTAGPFDHSGVRWSPDGAQLVVVAARHEGWDLEEVADLWLVDPDPPAGGDPPAPRRLTDTTRLLSHPAWSPDGRRIAALEMDADQGWRQTRPVVVDVATGERTLLATAVDRTFAPYPGERAPIWDGDDALVVACEDRGRVVVHRLAVDPAAPPEPLTHGDQVVSAFDHAAGTLAAVVTDPTRPGELEVDGHRTAFCAGFVEAVPPLPARRFTVASPAGDGDVDCWLVTPAGFDPDAAAPGTWPLLLDVHGGPMSQYGDKWFDEFQLLAGAGFPVVAANPHGSSGREERWQRAIRSPKAALEPGTGWGGIDADDLLAVLEATLQRWPAFDPARVGVLGGSYGGFMTTLLLARTDRFAAGCSERAVNNLLSEEWSSDEGGHFWRELGVSHLEDPEEYVRMSPVTYVRGITAPILILHSEQDLRCHPEQADALFTALRLLGHPDVEYWRFPGEGHELSRSGAPQHRVRRAELITAFFERTIGGGPR